MSPVDILLVVIIVLATLGGWRQGFVLQVAAILGALAALAVARREYQDVRRLLAEVAPHSSWLTVISYLAVFLLVWAGILLVARRLRWALRFLQLGWIDRLGGVIVGFLQGLVLVELLLYFGRSVPDRTVRHAITHASLSPYFVSAVPYLQHLFPHGLGFR